VADISIAISKDISRDISDWIAEPLITRFYWRT
jgi:hypothetical protein